MALTKLSDDQIEKLKELEASKWQDSRFLHGLTNSNLSYV